MAAEWTCIFVNNCNFFLLHWPYALLLPNNPEEYSTWHTSHFWKHPIQIDTFEIVPILNILPQSHFWETPWCLSCVWDPLLALLRTPLACNRFLNPYLIAPLRGSPPLSFLRDLDLLTLGHNSLWCFWERPIQLYTFDIVPILNILPQSHNRFARHRYSIWYCFVVFLV